MTERIEYAHGWSLGRKKLTRPITAEEARDLHESGQPYAALLSDDDTPLAAIRPNLAFRTLTVTYLGDDLRQTHSHIYWLRKEDETRMYLHEMSFFEVPVGANGGPAKFHFRLDGDTWRLRASIPDAAGSAPLQDVPGEAPPTWETGTNIPVPAFGEYRGLYRPDAYDPLEFVRTA